MYWERGRVVFFENGWLILRVFGGFMGWGFWFIVFWWWECSLNKI